MTLPSSGPLSLTDIQTEFGGTNPIGMNEYYAGGGLVPAGTTGTYGAVPSSGALSVQNFYGTSAVIPAYIEEVFSTYLYKGTGSSLSINNGINESGNGALTWIKARTYGAGHCLFDTSRGVGNRLMSNNTSVNIADNTTLTAFNSNGFSLGTDSSTNINVVNESYVSWTFQKKPKFFDIVTYTGTGAVRTIAHNLGSVPGCIIVKRYIGTSSDWYVQHRSLGPTYDIFLNSTSAALGSSNAWNSTAPTSTVFSLGFDSNVNLNGATYVAYLFAHDAGGFGLTGTDNVISCGSFSFSAGKTTVNLGYEPQYLLMKKTNGAEQWWVFDVMRGMTASLTGNNYLGPNTYLAENDLGSITQPTATGFYLDWSNSGITTGDYIYIAIRRGPMKVPTSGTSVFAPVTYAGTDTITNVTTNIVPSLAIVKGRGAQDWYWTDMLRGPTKNLRSNTTGAEQYDGKVTPNNTGFTLSVNNGFTNAGVNFISYSFLRAPKFFDEVCYTGTGVAGLAVNHNLGVAPEMMIIKRRNSAWAWAVYYGVTNKYLVLNTTAATASDTIWNSSLQTASVFTLGDPPSVNNSGSTYVAYLFATLAGVSKVGSYAGNGSSQTINCGFTGGVRFLMIKNTTFGGTDWQVWDTARGITAGNDPVLYLNAAQAEVNANFISNTSTGFTLNDGDSQYNASGSTYIYLAIA